MWKVGRYWLEIDRFTFLHSLFSLVKKRFAFLHLRVRDGSHNFVSVYRPNSCAEYQNQKGVLESAPTAVFIVLLEGFNTHENLI